MGLTQDGAAAALGRSLAMTRLFMQDVHDDGHSFTCLRDLRLALAPLAAGLAPWRKRVCQRSFPATCVEPQEQIRHSGSPGA
jgi:hypothetical protein